MSYFSGSIICIVGQQKEGRKGRKGRKKKEKKERKEERDNEVYGSNFLPELATLQFAQQSGRCAAVSTPVRASCLFQLTVG